MAKTIIEIGKRKQLLELITCPDGGIALRAVENDDTKEKKPVNKTTRIIGADHRTGRVLRNYGYGSVYVSK